MNTNLLKIILTVVLAISISLPLNCGTDNKKESKPTKQDFILALTAFHFNFNDRCVLDYGQLSFLFPTYLNSIFLPEGNVKSIVIIGDSTLDIGRQYPTFYSRDKVSNRAVGGNTACDFMYQLDYIFGNPEYMIIGTMDGNGTLRGIHPQVSADTLIRTINKATNKWVNLKPILIEIHPVLIESANKTKNEVNRLMREYANSNSYCIINMVELFGVGESDPPPLTYMADNIHYTNPIFDRLRDKIKSQCDLDIN